MSQTDYAEMTNEQLKHYIINHREDEAALRAYLDRRDVQNLPIIANVRDIDFDDKLRTAISQKLENPAII
jgi:ribosomal protein L29